MQAPSTDSPGFLAGGGEMGALIRAKDWSKTPLGPPETWPQSLRIAVSIMLDTHFGMHIAWGEDYLQLYNDGYRPVLGETKHPAALGLPIKDSFPEIWEDFVQPKFADVMRGEPFGAENLLIPQYRNRYLEEGYFTFSYSPIRDERGRVGGVLTTETETTEHVIRERRLQTSRNVASLTSTVSNPRQAGRVFMQALQENAYDIPFALLYVIEAREARLEARLAEHLRLDGHPSARPERIDGSVSPEAAWPLAQVLEADSPQLVTDLPERFGSMPGGAWPEPAQSAYLLPIHRLDRKQIYGVLVLGVNPRKVFDTQQREFFESLAEQATRLFATASALEEERRRMEALRQLDEAKTAFFSNVSHEFRTPLTLMLGPLEETLHAHDALPVALHQNLETAHRNALRLQKLVNTLLDFSRIEAGRMRASYAPTNLAALTADLASSFRSAVERAGMDLVVDCPPLPEPAYIDREMWEKIVLNLLSNAFKYTLEGQISVRLTAEEGQAVLRVRDTGVGIPDAELPRLFERFHRVAGSRGRTFEGTGIGLSLIRELVGLHGGTIGVESEPGVGSTFTVRMPLGKEHLPSENVTETSGGHAAPGAFVETFLTEAAQLTPGPAAAAAQPPKGGLKPSSTGNAPFGGVGAGAAHVLVVDDNADMRAYIQRLLEPHYRVTAAPDGQAALWLVAEHRPDLVLSDVMMPVMNGFELLKTLKADPQTAATPVILLSARAGEEATIEGYEAGADDYLVKPFSANELLARVRAQLNMARVRSENGRQLRNLFEQAPVGINILRGPELRFDLVNDFYARLVGRQPDQILGKPLLEALPEIASQGYFDLLTRVMQTGEPMVFTEQPVEFFRNGQSETVYLNFHFEALPKPDSGVFVIVVEVTDSVRARRKVEESEQQLQTLFKQAPVGIAILRGPEHTFEIANDFYVQLVGRRRADEIVGKALFEALPEIEGQGFDRLLTNVVETGVPLVAKEQPVQLVRNGQLETAHVDFVYQPLPAPDSGVFVVVTDVTASVLARQKIEESEERLTLALEAVEMGTWAYDLRTGAITASERTAELHGLAVGEPFNLERGLATAAETDRQRVAAAVASALQPASGGGYNVEYTLSNSPGEHPRIIQAKGKAFFDENGEAHRLIGTALDITDRKRRELNVAFLADVGNVFARFSTPDEIIGTVGAKLGAYLGVSACLAADINEPADEVRIDYAWETPETTNLRGVYRLSEFATDALNRAARAGEPFVVNDTQADARVSAAGYGAFNIHSFVTVPARRNGEWKFLFTVNCAQKRAWRRDEIELVEELTARIFPRLERARAEEALRRQTTLLNTVNDNTTELIFMKDVQGRLTYCNQATLDAMGLTPEAAIGSGGEVRFRDASEAPAIDANDRRVMETGEVLAVEETYTRADGERRVFLSTKTPLRDELGAILGVIGVSRDVTESKRAEAALRESDRWFRQLADSMPQIVWTARPDGHLDYYNRRWYEFIDNDLGFGDAGWLPILHPDDRQPCLDQWHRCLQTGEPYQFEFRLDDVRQPGQYRWYLARATAFRNEQNLILKWFGTCTDIHAQKTEAERLEKLVRERTRELQTTNAELERSNLDLMQFASVASHDLKEPLRKIQAFGNILTKRLDGKLDPGDQDYFGRIIGASNRMQALVEDVLSLSKLSSRDVAHAPVDLNGVVARIVDDLEITIREKGAAVRVGTLPRLQAVPGQMHQLFQNLISNALKFSENRPPEVDVETVPLTPELRAELKLPHADYAVVEVRDNGIGFEPQYRERIFGMFQRLNGRAEYAGTGIGLTICRRIAENHGGFITAEGEPDRGATFRVVLPVRQG